MQKSNTTTCSIPSFCLLILSVGMAWGDPSLIRLQSDGSLSFLNSSEARTDEVKQGTPRQAVNCGGQTMNISYGFNSLGKKTILLSLPKSSPTATEFILSDRHVSLSPGSSLRMTLNENNQLERMDGTPVSMVIIEKVSSQSDSPPMTFSSLPQKTGTETAETPESTVSSQASQPAPQETTKEQLSVPLPSAVTESENSPALQAETKQDFSLTKPSPAPLNPTDPMGSSTWAGGWPGKLLDRPIPAGLMEEDSFYVRTEGGPRFVSSMNIVNVVGPNGPSNSIIQKEVAYSTGYRQDIDAGVWLTDWFGMSIETGFALNAMRGNTQGMTVTSSTYWSVPLLAQLCFQYPNDSGFLPYINLGFGGGWNYFKIGSINYNGPNFTKLSGSGNDMNNAYQIAAGVRYRLYEQLSLTLAYKFYGTSQPTVDMGDDQQVTFGSPVTNTIEIGGSFSF